MRKKKRVKLKEKKKKLNEQKIQKHLAQEL